MPGKLYSNGVSVVCRAYDGEAPYIASFVEHYKQLGCSEFHIVVPKGNPYSLLKQALRKESDVHLITDHGIDHFNDAQNAALKNVRTSHLLWVDVDEYLDSENIDPLLDADYTLLRWAIVPWSLTKHPTSTWGFLDSQVKYAVRTSLCEQLNIHSCLLKHDQAPSISPTRLLHYVYRSYSDLFIKCAAGDYQSYQKTHRDNLLQGTHDCSKLPLKYKMAAIYQRISINTAEKYRNLCLIEPEYEQQLVSKSAFSENYAALEESFFQYFSRIDLMQLLKNVQKHSEYRQKGRLPHYLLAELSDSVLLPKLEERDYNCESPRGRKTLIQIITSLRGRNRSAV